MGEQCSNEKGMKVVRERSRAFVGLRLKDVEERAGLARHECRGMTCTAAEGRPVGPSSLRGRGNLHTRTHPARPSLLQVDHGVR